MANTLIITLRMLWQENHLGHKDQPRLQSETLYQNKKKKKLIVFLAEDILKLIIWISETIILWMF